LTAFSNVVPRISTLDLLNAISNIKQQTENIISLSQTFVNLKFRW